MSRQYQKTQDIDISYWIGDTTLGRYNKNPRMRVQKAENVNKALEFITSRGVKLTNIGPEGVSFNNLRSLEES